MDFLLDHEGEAQLKAYFDRIGDVLGYQKRRASFALYAFGLFGDAERKSVEPIAARACADPAKTDALHQRLCHFMVDSDWSDRDVRLVAAHCALDALTKREPIENWIIDDSGWLKQGKHSVGVQRQYTRTAREVSITTGSRGRRPADRWDLTALRGHVSSSRGRLPCSGGSWWGSRDRATTR